MAKRCILFLWLFAGSLQAMAGLEVYATVDSFTYSEPVTIKAALNELQGDYRSGELAFTHEQGEIGFKYNNWSLGFLVRYDLYSRFHPDTAELLYLSENDLPVELERSFQLDMEVSRLRSTGLKLAYGFVPSSYFRGHVAASYLKTSQLLDGNVSGVLTTQADGKYSGQGRIDYVYDEDLVLEREVRAPSGDGVTFDVGFNWRLSELLELDVDLQDLYSRIVWHRAPRTQGDLNSNVIDLDENGVINNARALYSATDSFQTFIQRLSKRETVTLKWTMTERFYSGVQFFRFEGADFPRFIGGFNVGENTEWRAMYDLKTRALGLGVQSDYIKLFLLSDTLDPSKAHVFALNAGVNVSF